MRNSILPLFFVLAACSAPQATKYELLTSGAVERLDSAIHAVIPKDAQIEVLASGFDWSEGPLWLETEQALIFSDVPSNQIWKWSEQDSLTLYLEPSGYLGDRSDKREPGSNGLALDISGDLILCQHGERQIARMLAPLNSPSSSFEALATGFEEKRFNSPNDLVFNTQGQLFFTDLPYGLDLWNEKELEYQGVYRLDVDGSLDLLVDSLNRPNGIALSPDERWLYVAQSDAEQARYYAFELDAAGEVLSGKVLLDVTGLQSEARKGLPDGLKVHSSGVLFASGPGGILIIDAQGKHLGTILTGLATANCAFDSDEKYLYMTADSLLLRLKLK